MHTNPSNNKRKSKQQKLALLRQKKYHIDEYGVVRSNNTKRPLVSTLTHTTRQVAEHFIKWRDNLKNSMIGHNGGPKVDD